MTVNGTKQSIREKVNKKLIEVYKMRMFSAIFFFILKQKLIKLTYCCLPLGSHGVCRVDLRVPVRKIKWNFYCYLLKKC